MLRGSEWRLLWLRSMGVIAGVVGMGNPWRDSPEAIARKCEGMPLVRIKATGIAAGPRIRAAATGSYRLRPASSSRPGG